MLYQPVITFPTALEKGYALILIFASVNSEIFGYDFLVNVISPECYHRVLKYHEIFRSIIKTYLSYEFN